MNEPIDLLIMGAKSDPHVDWVATELKNYDVKVVILDALESTSFTVDQKSDGVICNVDGSIIDECTVIWSRSKLYYGSPFYFQDYDLDNQLSRSERRLDDWREKEWVAAINVINLIDEGRLVSNIPTSAFMYKVNQHKIAQKMGFKTLDTIVTNDLTKAKKFIEMQGRCIAKSISSKPVLPEADEHPRPYGVMTVEVSNKDLERLDAREFAKCPHMFQKLMEKDYELRIVDINGRLFPFRINSAKFKHTELDWRHGGRVNDFIFELTELPDGFETKLAAFREHYSLFSGSFDFIVRDGEYYFLECNKEGAWAWLEKYADKQIAKAFAEEFVKLIQCKRGKKCHKIVSAA